MSRCQLDARSESIGEGADTGTTGQREPDQVPWYARLVKREDVLESRYKDNVIEHDVEWLLAQCDVREKEVLIISNERDVVPLFVHDGKVDLQFSDLTLGGFNVRRHVLVGNFPDCSLLDWDGAMSALAASLPKNGVVFLLGLVKDERLAQLLNKRKLRDSFFVCAQGTDYARRLCLLDGDFEGYLESLPGKSRQDLRRSLRRFEANFAGRFEFTVYSMESDVTYFLKQVQAVSARTYQGRRLGLMIGVDSYIGRKVREGARLGYSRCYMLTVDGKPVAWRIGFLYGNTYFSHHIGYDPDFEKWHPGVVGHLLSLRDLSENCKDVRILDMLYGDNDFKRKASNSFRCEQNYYLFPKTVRGALVYFSLKISNKCSEVLGVILERFGLKGWIRKIIRRI